MIASVLVLPVPIYFYRSLKLYPSAVELRSQTIARASSPPPPLAGPVDVGSGSTKVLTSPKSDFRFYLNNGSTEDFAVGPVRATSGRPGLDRRKADMTCGVRIRHRAGRDHLECAVGLAA